MRRSTSISIIRLLGCIGPGAGLAGILVGLLLAAWCPAAETTPGASIVGLEQVQATRAALAGEWTCEIGQTRTTLQFDETNRFEIGDKTGPYSIAGKTLRLVSETGTVVYDFELNGTELTLTGGDLTQPLKFTKVAHFGESTQWRQAWSPAVVKTRLRRIAVIIGAGAVCLAAVAGLRALMQWIIYSEWGPLRFLYRRHKKRTMTIYSLILNISKYVVYLLAVGFILTELGVNYRMYFASLSVVGLAIGFGSQGLVQDMVTGFFVVFEEQFNVGDMVEIPPHTGVVEDLGLRMTRLRNYLGQRVVIPNRNIAAVGNYLHGAQQVYLDVAAPAEAEKAGKTLTRIAADIAGQFQDIVLSAPESLGEISLCTGERFLRLHLSIWPQQQWVIEAELVPRLLAGMGLAGLAIPGGKIVVHYHPRPSRTVTGSGRGKGAA